MPTFEPAYLQTHRSGLLRRKAEQTLETALAPAEHRRALEEAVEEGITRLDRPHRVLRWV